MVRAILEGRKTQTRRIAKYQEAFTEMDGETCAWTGFMGWQRIEAVLAPENAGLNTNPEVRCPYGVPGDRLWVREAHAIMSTDPGTVSIAYRERLPAGKTLADTDGGLDVINVSDPDAWQWANSHINCERWRPSIFMPRWASRITLDITDVRVQRVRSISEEDAIAEGVEPWHEADLTNTGDLREESQAYKMGFADLWQGINGKGLWDADPWVWALTFKQVPA
jgi:hypothetical protein